jgi:hypothetical protein
MKTKSKTDTMIMKLVAILLSLLLLSCSTSTKDKTEAMFLQSLGDMHGNGMHIEHDVVESVLEQIPSPLEISMLLRQSGIKFNRNVLNASTNTSKYNTNFKKALNLGIYGADLGYTNIYEQNGDGMRYLSSIKALADDLRIGHFFDLNTIARLAASSNNLDSLLLVTTQNFNSINSYLHNQNRSNLSVLFLVGGWLEGLQILSQVSAHHPGNAQLIEKIGEQKIVLEQFLLLLSFHEEDESMISLRTDLEELKEIYDSVSITHTYRDSSIEIVDGIAVIKDNSTTIIDISHKEASRIKNKVGSIRSKIIS